MKECEKQLEKLPLLDTDGRSIAAEERGFRLGWQAALEWAKGQLQEQYEGGLSAYDAIDKELDDDPPDDI